MSSSLIYGCVTCGAQPRDFRLSNTSLSVMVYTHNNSLVKASYYHRDYCYNNYFYYCYYYTTTTAAAATTTITTTTITNYYYN